MKDGRMTTEKLRAIERWENEGGRVSRRPMENIRKDEPAPRDVVARRKQQSWQNADVSASWRWTS